MVAKILAMFALLAVLVSAATAVSFPQYYPSLIAFGVNNPYSQYDLPRQDVAVISPQSLSMTAQQQYCARQTAQQQIVQQVQQQQIQQ
jgi:hypothetical protein